MEQRWKLVTDLALELWQTTERAVSLTGLSEAAAVGVQELAFSPVGPRLEVGELAHTIGSGTLLVRDEGAFRFVHESVLEWVVANHAAVALERGDPAPRRAREAAHVGPHGGFLLRAGRA